MLKSHKLSIAIGICCTLSLFFSCSKKSAQSKSAFNANPDNFVRFEAPVNITGSTILTMPDGEAKGSIAEVFPSSLPAGAKVVISQANQPDAFKEAINSHEPALLAISAPITLLAKDSSSNLINKLNLPMQVSLPYIIPESNMDLLNSSGEKKDKNICAIGSINSVNYVWHRDMLSIDATKKVVKFNSLAFGTYQLILCGMDPIKDFVEIKTSDLVLKSNFQLKFPTQTYGYGAHHICLLLLNTYDVLSDDMESTYMILNSKSYPNEGKDLDMSLGFSQDALSDLNVTHEIKILFQTAEQKCGYTAGQNLSQIPSYQRSLNFRAKKEELRTGKYNGTMGVGPYALDKYSISLKGPSGSSYLSSQPQEKIMCFESNSYLPDQFGWTDVNVQSKSDFSLNGSDLLTLDIPHQDGAPSLYGYVGVSCPDSYVDEADLSKGQYELTLKNPIASVYYLASFELKVTSPVLGQEQGKASCVRAYNAGKIPAANVDFKDLEYSSFSSWSLLTQTPPAPIKVFIPWDPKQPSDKGFPIYDFLITPNLDCSNSVLSPKEGDPAPVPFRKRELTDSLNL
ncbi:MAG: hypothetical protein KA436_00050 [Oligoflexales bacterium]|nr:hypothetical protein [Oligoflexales bacterium]